MSKKAFGTTSKGVEASLYEISNGSGVTVSYTHLDVYKRQDEGRELSQLVNDFTWYMRNLLLLQSSDDMEEVLDISTVSYTHLHTTAASHKRVFIVEVMGHKVGWLTLYAGVAGGADIIPVSYTHLCQKNL